MAKWVRGGGKPSPQAGTLLQVRPFALHGMPYYALLFRLDSEPDGVREARLSHEMLYAAPQAGDRVMVTMVLGVVDNMRPADGDTEERGR